MQAAAPQLGLQLAILQASNDLELEAAFAKAKEMRAGGLVIAADPFAISHLKEIADQALKGAMPSIFVNPQFAEVGRLMSYSGTIIETHHLAGGYVGRILKGEKPGELPVIQGTKVELIVNLKTAKALGITISLSLLGRAGKKMEMLRCMSLFLGVEPTCRLSARTSHFDPTRTSRSLPILHSSCLIAREVTK